MRDLSAALPMFTSRNRAMWIWECFEEKFKDSNGTLRSGHEGKAKIKVSGARRAR